MGIEGGRLQRRWRANFGIIWIQEGIVGRNYRRLLLFDRMYCFSVMMVGYAGQKY
jgi:hypothetical protein